jgi:hypothetical protein
MVKNSPMRSPFRRHGLLVVLMTLVLTQLLASCYVSNQRDHAAYQYSERQIDSLSFFSSHHYTNNYNFIVKADSLSLLRQMPEEYLEGMQTDSFVVRKGDHLVVADIHKVPTDKIDSVWVQLANDSSVFGWTRESHMLPCVMPDDPISQFISAFSDAHVIIFLVIIVIIAASYLLWSIRKHKAHLVHVNDIESFYPTLLCLIVASSATFYASLQTFAPQMWVHFYYHPTLNPFSVPFALGIFLTSVWAMLIVAIAAIDDVRHQLPFDEALLYLGGLAAVCAVDYIVFSVTSLYFVGYLLLAAYVSVALWQYFRKGRARYICGNCGARLRKKGRCPYCGALNE